MLSDLHDFVHTGEVRPYTTLSNAQHYSLIQGPLHAKAHYADNMQMILSSLPHKAELMTDHILITAVNLK